MKALLSLLAASLCAACTVSPWTTTASAPKKTIKPGYCANYPAENCSIAQCDVAFGQACPNECTGGTDGQPPACSPSMSCEAAKTAEYHNCLGRCTAIPVECR